MLEKTWEKACVESGLVMRIWGMGHCKLCTMSTKADVPLWRKWVHLKGPGLLREERLQTEMEEDLEFLTSGAEAATEVYSRAVEGSRSSDQTMKELAWTVVGFEEQM